MAPEGTQSLLPAASGRIKAFLWKDDCHISWQQKFHTSSQGKLTLFAWKAAILAGLLSLSATFHYSWQSQGKHNGKAVVQLPDSPGILSGKLWDGFCAQGWAQQVRQHNPRRGPESQPGSQGGGQGHTWSRRSPQQPQGVPVLPSCCPGHPHTLPSQGGRLGWAPCRAGPEQHPRAQSSAWAAVPCHPPALLTPHWQHCLHPCQHLCTTTPPVPAFPWNRHLRHSRTPLAKPILQELESPAASNIKAAHSIAIF